MDTIAAMLRARQTDESTGLRFEDASWTWAEHVQASADRAAWLLDLRQDGPFHVGVLLDNVPEFSFVLGAGALSGATIVGLNSTRSAAELASDAAHTDCQLVITEERHRDKVAALELPADRILSIDAEEYRAAVAEHASSALPDVEVGPGDTFMLIFTSGTAGAPKAVICSHGKIAFSGLMLAEMTGLTADDIGYSTMPLFHSNAVIAGWTPMLYRGMTVVLRRKFSASSFLADVRRYGATYANYVGKPLSYILAQPPSGDDADNPLRLVFGNEAADSDIAEFGRRFGCEVVDGYGSTEGGLHVTRDEQTPKGSLGKPIGNVVLLSSQGEECPDARFDEHGRLLNAEVAIGEMVNLDGPGSFEGYYKNPEAEAQRVQDGRYHSGDLAYRDAQGYLYFAGRLGDWLRVDGENFASAPIERMLTTHPDIVEAVAYGVPDPAAGDQVMIAIVLREVVTFDPTGFAAWLTQQPEASPKWMPAFVRAAEALPQTPTNKVRKSELQREAWLCGDPVWYREGAELSYRPLTPEDRARLEKAFAEHGREHVLPA